MTAAAAAGALGKGEDDLTAAQSLIDKMMQLAAFLTSSYTLLSNSCQNILSTISPGVQPVKYYSGSSISCLLSTFHLASRLSNVSRVTFIDQIASIFSFGRLKRLDHFINKSFVLVDAGFAVNMKFKLTFCFYRTGCYRKASP